ncbi:transcriptional regulator, LacI family [Nocardioides terrae]|uniref:Transcriptional regulator, LacI family n=1 Tax=Nocardioides terrae TaxID=574651 RepID=A0A1I1MZW6_9ACTN|nr:LacI family DNA-binding transcriptional regulator [Nocardioides terrae]SFC88113.1 transcriptional regulator, LacI family [Nocardioides terrae]
MAGIKDVAREVSLSTATVSRALRGLPGVSDANRLKVTDAARRLGYVPSPSAVGLASGQTRTVAVIVPHVTRWFFGEVVQGAEEVLRTAGYDLLLYNLAGEPAARHRVFHTDLLSKRVDAVLVLGLRPTEEERRRLAGLGRPVAIVGAAAPDLFSVSIDDEQAARIATGHLLDLGHTRVGYLGGSLDSLDFVAPSARLAGYRAALRERGIEHHPELEDVGEFTVAGGRAAAARLLAGPDRPTAIFAASDEMAIGVLRAARELGLSVPSDLSVVGIDDHELAGFFDLTTVAQPVREQGRRGAERVLAELTGVRPPESEVLPVELVVRTSTAAPACPSAAGPSA